MSPAGQRRAVSRTRRSDRRPATSVRTPVKSAGLAGFSLFEFALVAIILSILTAVLLGRLHVLAAEAEKLTLDLTVRNLRMAIGMKFARALMADDRTAMLSMAGSNPADHLESPLPDYAGTRAGVTEMAPGRWYFDTAAGTLNYRVRHPDFFESSDGVAEARFALRPQFEDMNGDGVYDPARDRLTGVRLVPIGHFRWKS